MSYYHDDPEKDELQMKINQLSRHRAEIWKEINILQQEKESKKVKDQIGVLEREARGLDREIAELNTRMDYV